MEPDISETIENWIKLTLSKSFYGIFKFSKESDVSMPQIGALMRIYRKKNCSVSVIGEDMGTSSAAASQLLHRMVQIGLIERSEDPNDRRSKQLNLTQKGIDFLNECFHASYKWFENFVITLDSEEKRDIVATLNKLITNININNGKSDLEK